jgi:hypothetical protein
MGWMITDSILGSCKRLFLSYKNTNQDWFWKRSSSRRQEVLGVLSLGVKSGQRVLLTANLFLLQRLRMSGSAPLLPMYVFMVCTGATQPFTRTLLNPR